MKEFLIPKVRALVDGLPFTPEGDARANSILLAKFRKHSEVVAANIQCITSFRAFSNAYPNEIKKSYDKLVVIVQPVDTINKLRDIKLYECLTFDKLPKIMDDFFRLFDECQ